MADEDPRDQIPDLVIPPPRRSNQGIDAVRPEAPPAAPAPEQASALADDFADLEIERGGALAMAPTSSSRAGAPAGSGIELSYRRLDPKPVVELGPTTTTKVLARVVPGGAFLVAAAALAKLAHRSGGRGVLTLAPHAFDASSTAQSGAAAGVAIVLALAIGVIGLRLQPRSYAMLTAAGALVLTSLAMVTVTLVSTDEHPGPADGALVVPYLVPLALLLLGLGIARRGPQLFLEGGMQRLTAFVAGLAGGAIAFAAIELSALAARLP